MGLEGSWDETIFVWELEFLIRSRRIWGSKENDGWYNQYSLLGLLCADSLPDTRKRLMMRRWWGFGGIVGRFVLVVQSWRGCGGKGCLGEFCPIRASWLSRSFREQCHLSLRNVNRMKYWICVGPVLEGRVNSFERLPICSAVLHTRRWRKAWRDRKRANRYESLLAVVNLRFCYLLSETRKSTMMLASPWPGARVARKLRTFLPLWFRSCTRTPFIKDALRETAARFKPINSKYTSDSISF